MAENPFKIDDLNGLSLDDDAIHKVTVSNLPGEAGGSSVSPFLLNGQLPSPGEIAVINSDYTAGRLGDPNDYGYQNYYLPNFGQLQFEGVVDGDGNPINFWIHGFSENGLLLSNHEIIGWPTTGGTFVTPSGVASDIFVFGSYGVSSGVTGGDSDDVLVGNGFAIFDKDPGVFAIPEGPVVCFAEATGIATPTGRVAVERLNVGDLIVTASGAVHPVQWIGDLTARPGRHPRPNEVNPVRVCAGAFGPGSPERDLRLSPGHAVYVDGVLVPIGHLVNGATIVQEEVESIRYFHIELASHDVILAEGLPCESYLDDGNRSTFANAEGPVALHGRLDPKSWDNACAPMVADGPQLVAIQQRLLVRAEALGWSRCEAVDLIIEADGATILPEQDVDNRFRFDVPAADRIVLRSTSGVLAHVMPGMADRRRLGVAIAALRIDAEPIAFDHAHFGAGFHAAESHGDTAWRWTDGAGVIDLGDRGACMIEIDIAMVAPSWRRETAARLRTAA